MNEYCSRPGLAPGYSTRSVRGMGLRVPSPTGTSTTETCPGKRQSSLFTLLPDGGSLGMSGHEMNLCANMAQKRSVLNATPANEIGMARELRIGHWRSPERQPPKRAPALALGESTV